MKLILHYLKKYKMMFFLNLISVFGFALVELGIPTIVADMVDKGVMTSDTQYIWKMGGVIVTISILGVAGTILLGYCCSYLSTSITRDIRNDIFKKAQTFSHSEFNDFGISSLITRTNNDAFQIQMFLNILFRIALMTPVMMIASFILVFRSSVSLSFIIASTVPIIILGVIFVAKKSKPISESQQMSLETINRISKENLTGIRVIRAFNNDIYEQERFADANKDYTGYSKQIFKLMTMTQPIFFLLMNLAGAAIFWVAAFMIDSSTLEVGKLMSFMDYLFHAMFSVMLFCTVFMMYPKAEVSAKRINKVLVTKPLVKNAVDAVPFTGDVDIIEYDHVTFVYPDGEEAVLKDVSFQVKKGQTIAFIGSTGSGKSTLINLIPRCYNVTNGSIKINGRKIEEYDIPSLRKAIGFIPQKAQLFRGTIADNIRFGKKDASDEEIMCAAKTAQAYDFILEKGGFEENISEGATNVSGGQKQRLAIARALVRRPKIYIFDDSFSALDFKTDAELRKQLHKETGNSIVMIVAQRVSSIMNADHIIVLDEGKVVGNATHKELLKICPIYYEIAASQLSEEELAQ
ncbi:MAG: ABC transporter ATP-binding protein [Oscillospiraceae bacterium]